MQMPEKNIFQEDIISRLSISINLQIPKTQFQFQNCYFWPKHAPIEKQKKKTFYEQFTLEFYHFASKGENIRPAVINSEMPQSFFPPRRGRPKRSPQPL